MMNGGDDRQPGRRDLEQAGAETLIVVHDVEIRGSIGQQPGRPQAEGARLRKPGRPHGGQLEQIEPVSNLAGPRHPERIGFAVQVEAGHLGEAHPWVEYFGVRLTGEDLDIVAQLDQTRG